MNVLVAITGATGVQIGVRLLERLKEKKVSTELIISDSAEQVISSETKYKVSDLVKSANKVYDVHDLSAAPSSESHKIDAMVISPCSMKTLAAISNGYADNLITRAADVTIKEQRRLILVVRESPLSPIHLENMLKLARIGVIIAPPMPSFYIKPKSVDELIDQSVGRVLDLLGIESGIKRWGDEG